MTTDEKRTKGIPLSDIKPSQHRRAFWKQYKRRCRYTGDEHRAGRRSHKNRYNYGYDCTKHHC